MKVYEDNVMRGGFVACSVSVESGSPDVVNVLMHGKSVPINAETLAEAIPVFQRAIERSRAATKALREISTAPFVEARER